ncbi:MAG: hypothetical protein RJA22_3298 [Verrucomicrobiota bacterium]|jgi:hypothetical protein
MRTPLPLLRPALLAGWLLLGAVALPAATWTQTLHLYYGWNAVWLEVEPRGTNDSLLNVDQVFTSPNYLIDTVAVMSGQAGTAEFITDTNQLFNQPGWIVWSLTNASAETSPINAQGQRAYLVHVSPRSPGLYGDGTPATPDLVVSGDVSFSSRSWALGKFNLMGFNISGAPTFRSLLGPGGFVFGSTTSTGTDKSPVQRLDPADGRWKDVNEADPVEPGRAYWVRPPFTFIGPRYDGPVAIAFADSYRGRLAFGSTPPSLAVTNPFNTFTTLKLNPAELTFSSLEATNGRTHTVTLNKLSDAGDQDLRLFHVERVPDRLAWQTDPGAGPSGVIQSWSPGSLSPGQSRTITLGLDRNWSSGGNYREQLYRLEVSLDGGLVYYYLPVSALNFDVPSTNAPIDDVSRLAGLWVGTITADAVLSLTETNRPVNKTASRAQLRVLLHVDTNGTPVLLAKVMGMQTKTADPSVLPEQVLILDEAQIPYYEGIQERGGKKVGIRFETVGFDMPRDNGTNAQSAAFLQRAGGTTNVAQVTDAQVSAYLAGQSSRPPDLNEAYHDRWPLAGRFGPGNTIGTGTNAPLRLDAFHRTNPFRHAYHPQHGAGYDITRNFTIQLDAAYQSGSGRLTGRYEEVTTGLATSALVARGTIVLQRASYVDRLQ